MAVEQMKTIVPAEKAYDEAVGKTMKIYKVFEVVKQAKPSLLFPDEPVSKRWSFAGIHCGTEQEARSRAVEDEYYKYRVRERVFRFVRKSGFTRDGIPVHNVEVRETISLRTVGDGS